MSDITINKIPEDASSISADDAKKESEKFIPKGAIAFFVLLMILCALIWYGIYYIALTRQ
ncbi:MAG TPA: hypothetical protein PL045_09725 [Chitinophagaceae bacterium]|nr:hypothetical protein [Chitinophagaceae bacterium]